MDNTKNTLFTHHFRRKSVHSRRKIIEGLLQQKNQNDLSLSDFASTGRDETLLDLSEFMIEQAVGYFAIPLGLVGPILMDGKEYMIPLATEEPSVLAALSYFAKLMAHRGSIQTFANRPIMSAQIIIEDKTDLGVNGVNKILASEKKICDELSPLLASMTQRGGGWQGMDARWIALSQTFVVNVKIDVRDAMGANLLNSAAERIQKILEDITGGQSLMAILSNRSQERMAGAKLCIPAQSLAKMGFNGMETAQRIVRANQIAQLDTDRAVTHNKGIMNGISALALATGNDTRAIEAAAHAHASRSGTYQGLSQFWMEEGLLYASLEMPLPFAVIGGAVGFHPTSRWSLNMMDNPDSQGLSRIAAAVGLLQNLAALRALVSEGIQKGHMELHARRLSFDAGARGEELNRYSQVIRSEGIRSRSKAKIRYKEWSKNSS